MITRRPRFSLENNFQRRTYTRRIERSSTYKALASRSQTASISNAVCSCYFARGKSRTCTQPSAFDYYKLAPVEIMLQLEKTCLSVSVCVYVCIYPRGAVWSQVVPGLGGQLLTDPTLNVVCKTRDRKYAAWPARHPAKLSSSSSPVSVVRPASFLPRFLYL